MSQGTDVLARWCQRSAELLQAGGIAVIARTWAGDEALIAASDETAAEQDEHDGPRAACGEPPPDQDSASSLPTACARSGGVAGAGGRLARAVVSGGLDMALMRRLRHGLPKNG